MGVIFLTLFIDLVGFSIIFPLFPAMLDHYLPREGEGSFLALFINLNISMMIVSFAAFSLIAYALDLVFHQVGLALLTSPGLESFWMQFFSCPVFLFASLNNTIVMGSLISTLAVSVPLFFLLNLLVVKYRHVYNTFIGRFPVLKFLKVLDVYEKAS